MAAENKSISALDSMMIGTMGGEYCRQLRVNEYPIAHLYVHIDIYFYLHEYILKGIYAISLHSSIFSNINI